MNLILLVGIILFCIWAANYFSSSSRKKRDSTNISNRFLAQLSALYGNDAGWSIRSVGIKNINYGIDPDIKKHWNKYFLNVKNVDLNSRQLHKALTEKIPKVKQHYVDDLWREAANSLPAYARSRSWRDRDDDIWYEKEFHSFIEQREADLIYRNDSRATETDLKMFELSINSLSSHLSFCNKHDIKGFYLSCSAYYFDAKNEKRMMPFVMIPSNDLPPHGNWRLVLETEGIQSDPSWVFDTPYQAKLYANSVMKSRRDG
jgi:hypothetical protein